MTGIERLRRLAGSQDMGNAWTAMLANELTDIADQIGREQRRDPAADVSVSAYDLLPEEEREAVAWVRKNGGLGAAMTMVNTLGDTLSWIRERAGLDKDEVVDYDELLDALDRRLMPEGMEWPRHESGELIGFGDLFECEGEPLTCHSVTVNDRGDFCLNDTWFKSGERVRRPAPKVLDADGRPLEARQTVWDVESGIEYEVVGIHTDEDTPVRVMRTDGSHLAKAAKPSTLTHQRPDSWERIEEDARIKPSEYTDRYRVGRIGFESEDMRADLVRRCRALAGVE